MPKIQNFSIRAGTAQTINFDVDPDVSTPDYIGVNIIWTVYKQAFGQPDPSGAVITKVLDDGLQIDDPAAHKFHVDLSRSDTLGLSGNYYHRAQVIDASGAYSEVTVGIMTVENSGDPTI